MELMILRRNGRGNEYFAGFNRHEWLAFDGGEEEYEEFLRMLRGERCYFQTLSDGNDYAIALIDLTTAKAVDKKFGFEGSFVREYKERTVKTESIVE